MTGDYTVTQNGNTYLLSTSAPYALVNANGVFLVHWNSGGAAISGYSARTSVVEGVAAGLDGSTYFAGASGTLSTTVPTTGTANYLGMYGFVVNGVDLDGPLSLTADFGAGTLFDTSAGIAVNGTISGADIGGDVIIGGETGTLVGGFYVDGLTNLVAGAVVGPNMAGIFKAH